MPAGLRPDPLGELKLSLRPLAAVKGLGPREGEGKRVGKGRRERRKEGRRGEKGWQGREREGRREGREEGTGRGPQFEKNDPPSSYGWLRACNLHLDNHTDHPTSQFLSVPSSFNLIQRVNIPTNNQNRILHLVITSSGSPLAPSLSTTSCSASDDFPIFTKLSTLQKL